jgi:ribosomal protein S18 acetylase RimI-like enzyme
MALLSGKKIPCAASCMDFLMKPSTCLQGADYASLGVESDNHHARRMYERCGWALVHEDRTKNFANYRKFVR